MARGFKTGGRQKGGANKASAVLAAAAAKNGEMPAEYMLRIMRDETVDNDRRDKMAVAVAPYVHPKLAAVEHTGANGGPIEVRATKEQRDAAVNAALRSTDA